MSVAPQDVRSTGLKDAAVSGSLSAWRGSLPTRKVFSSISEGMTGDLVASVASGLLSDRKTSIAVGRLPF